GVRETYDLSYPYMDAGAYSGLDPESRHKEMIRRLGRPSDAVTTMDTPTDLAAVAYERIRDLIVAGKLSPWALLVETELACRLQVSRTPIRSALQRLQQEGFVLVSRTGQSARAVVSPLTVDDMLELHAIVGALEGIAAELAAALDPTTRRALT